MPDPTVAKYTLRSLAKAIFQFFGLTADEPIGFDINGQIKNVSVEAGGDSYLKYVALLNQSGTNDPVPTVLENTLGGTVVWTRTQTGLSEAELTGAFPVNKVFSLVTFTSGDSLAVAFVDRLSNDVLRLKTLNGTEGSGDFIDGYGIFVEIRVYP